MLALDYYANNPTAASTEPADDEGSRSVDRGELIRYGRVDISIYIEIDGGVRSLMENSKCRLFGFEGS